METETKKTPFYSQKLDDKYTLLNKSIGIDTQTKKLSTRTIKSSCLESGILNGQQLLFSFTVSPSAYLDWNNCNMEIGFVFRNEKEGKKTGEADAAEIARLKVQEVSIPWNLLLNIFEEIIIKFNGTVVYNKVAGEYLETQTFKLLTEYNNKELNASEIVFAPVGDYNYNTGLKYGYGYKNDNVEYHNNDNQYGVDTSSDDPNAKIRFQNWISDFQKSYGCTKYKRPNFKDLFFSIPGFSKNLRNVNIDIKLKNDIPLAKLTHRGKGQMIITSMKLQLHEYNFSPSSAVSSLNSKINGEDEHISYIDVNKQDREYNNYLSITNQENIQWIAVTQFCHDVTSIVIAAQDAHARNKGVAKYQNCGQFLLTNGYHTQVLNQNENDPGNNNRPNNLSETDYFKQGDVLGYHLIHRSDLSPTKIALSDTHYLQLGSRCINPISSIQAQYGNRMYPSNAINTRYNIEGNNYLLKTDELYSEYKKAVGFKNPAVPEDIFKRTMPFFLVRLTPNLKLIQSGDIIIRMPGFNGNGNSGSKKVSIIYGQLKSFNISPSGIVNENVNSY